MPPFRPAFQRLAEASSPWALALVVVSIALLAWSAQLTIPVQPVPITPQSYVLLSLAALLGWRLAGLVALGYVALGAAGLPVFANGTGGLAALTGSSAGFIFGFVVVAVGVGAAEQRWARLQPLRLLAVFAAGHLALLALGAGWLATRAGTTVALEKAFLPFLPGAVIKCIAALATVIGAERLAGTPRRV